MNKQRRILILVVTACVGIAAVAAVSSLALAGGGPDRRDLKGTIWVANRGVDSIRGFDAATGAVVATWPLAAGSQPGDLGFARGKLYVSEEFGSAPALAVVDPKTGSVLKRFFVGLTARPHHVHVSRDGRLVSFGLYGTDTVGVVDARTDMLLGTWDTNPETTNGRAHAGVFSPDGRTLYVTSDATSELIALDPRTGLVLWRLSVPNAHELVITRDGKTAYVSARTGNAIRIVDLQHQVVLSSFPLATAPDTLQLARHDRLLTVGLRGSPAQLAVIDTRTLQTEIVAIGPANTATTIAGHQWTSPDGRFTFAAFEGPGAGVAVVDHRHGNAVVQTLDYPGRPHGVAFIPSGRSHHGCGDDDRGGEDD
jgi:DNA-binding beta-propeller fold protein YncE